MLIGSATALVGVLIIALRPNARLGRRLLMRIRI
jgi:hypothetical protein